MSRRFTNVQGAADILGVSTKTIRRMIANGKIEAHRINGNTIRIDMDAIDKMLDESRIE